jgi:hypothetical protein
MTEASEGCAKFDAMSSQEQFDFMVDSLTEYTENARRLVAMNLKFNNKERDLELHTHNIRIVLDDLMKSPLLEQQADRTLPIVRSWDALMRSLLAPETQVQGVTHQDWIAGIEVIKPLASVTGYNLSHLPTSSFR